MNFSCENHKLSDTHIQKENNSFENKFTCDICNKEYKSKSGLYGHKKKCKIVQTKEEEIEKKMKDKDIGQLLTDLYKENEEMKNMLTEIFKKKNITNIKNTFSSCNINSNNTIFIHIYFGNKLEYSIDINSLIEHINNCIKDINKNENQGCVKTVKDIIAEKLNDYLVCENPSIKLK